MMNFNNKGKGKGNGKGWGYGKGYGKGSQGLGSGFGKGGKGGFGSIFPTSGKGFGIFTKLSFNNSLHANRLRKLGQQDQNYSFSQQNSQNNYGFSQQNFNSSPNKPTFGNTEGKGFGIFTNLSFDNLSSGNIEVPNGTIEVPTMELEPSTEGAFETNAAEK